MAATADSLFADIKKVEWSGDHIDAINQYAIGHLDTAGEGTCFVGTVESKGVNVSGETWIFFKTGLSWLMVTTDRNPKSFEQDGRYLVFGRVVDPDWQVSVAGNPPQRYPLVTSHHMVLL